MSASWRGGRVIDGQSQVPRFAGRLRILSGDSGGEFSPHTLWGFVALPNMPVIASMDHCYADN